MEFLSNIIQAEDLLRIQPGEFNILKAPCGYGKTQFMFDERILQLARARKHILYLIQNKATRDMIASLYGQNAVVFTDSSASGWFSNRRGSLWANEEDEDYVHVMCYQTFAALLRNEGTLWLNDIDLIIWDEFDDIKDYYEGEVRALRKLLPNFSKEELVVLLQKGKPKSVVNFVYQIKELILEPAKIALIAISATPECAAAYFKEYINYIITGELELRYAARHTEFISNLIAAIQDGIFAPDGRKYWCYTKFVTDALRIEIAVRKQGFNPITLWSETNPNYRNLYTTEKHLAEQSIKLTGTVPPQYNFVITTGVLGRGVNVYDETYQDWICNSNEYEDVHQYMRARFSPERQYLLESARGLVDFIQHGIPAAYYEWNTVAQLKELFQTQPIYTNDISPARITTTAAYKAAYPAYLEARRYGKNKVWQYKLSPVS